MLRANEVRRRPGRGELVSGAVPEQSSGLEDRVGLSEGDRSSVVDGKVEAKARRRGRRSVERREEETMAGRRRRLARLWVRAGRAPGSPTVPGVAGRRLGAADGEGRVDEGCDGDRSSQSGPSAMARRLALSRLSEPDYLASSHPDSPTRRGTATACPPTASSALQSHHRRRPFTPPPCRPPPSYALGPSSRHPRGVL